MPAQKTLLFVRKVLGKFACPIWEADGFSTTFILKIQKTDSNSHLKWFAKTNGALDSII